MRSDKKKTLVDPKGWMHRVSEDWRLREIERFNRLPRGAWRDAVVGHPYNSQTELFPWELERHPNRSYTPFLFRLTLNAVSAGFTARNFLRLIGFSSSAHGLALKKWNEWMDTSDVPRIDPTGEGVDVDRLLEALIVASKEDSQVR